MSKSKYIFIKLTFFSAVIFLTSCEKEKTEYNKFGDSDSKFFGFSDFYSNIIIHEESISYYSQKAKKIFNNLFEYRNNRKLGQGVHSYKYVWLANIDKIIGFISVETEDKVEIVDARSFLSIKTISVERPRDLAISYDGSMANIIISCGENSKSGKLVILQAANYSSINEFEIKNEIMTGNKPGKIFVHDNYIYVFPNPKDGGNNITKIYHNNMNPYTFQKVEDIYVGENPVDFEFFHEGTTGHSNASLAILCKGTSTIPASMVNYNLVLNKVSNEYSFKTFEFQPESIVKLNFFSYMGNENDEIWFNANNKVYNAKLSNLNKPEILIDKDINHLTRVFYSDLNDTYLAISSDAFGLNTKLFIISINPLSIQDSISITGHAKKITGVFDSFSVKTN